MGPYHAKTLAPKWKPVGSSHGLPTSTQPIRPRLLPAPNWARRLLILITVAGSLLAPLTPADDHTPHPWPSSRGTPDGRASIEWTAGTGLNAIPEWHFRGRGSSRYERGITVWASPALAMIDGRPMAFIGGCDQALYALDLTNKSVRWSKLTNGHILDAPVIGLVQGEPSVFWGSSDRFIYAHRAADGQYLWSRELVPPTRTQAPAEIQAPLLGNGLLLITAFVHDKALPEHHQQGWLVALDPETGREFWRREISQGPVNAPAGLRIDGRFIVFTAARKGQISAFAVTRDGAEPLWQIQLPHEVLATPVCTPPDVRLPRLFIGSKFGDLVALDARTGERRWQRMTGNWVDNAACVQTIDGQTLVFVGSHDYSIYALRADDGTPVWRRPLGGEVYSAPTIFREGDQWLLAAASLDNHLYLLDAREGRVVTSYFTGEPVWDKISKGETLWGSPASITWPGGAAVIHGSYNGYVYSLPVGGEVSLRAKARSSAGLWIGLTVVGVVFTGVILPLTLLAAKGTSSS
ncbi:MAG: hypothetical protein A2498_02245 [Lentisphaerae bacterium RIFOXYC12_FULL_60_16]|nr:MAG: hypothetical protein A2498_02245 [Lentisphaerae bacterium RIFOXYC12_FULL_60_16]